MPIKLVVFDMAGTTVVDKNAVAEAFKLAFQNQDIELTIEEINPIMGYEKQTAIKMMLEKHGIEADEDMVENIHDDFIEEMMDFYEFSPEVKPLPGAEEVFQELKERSMMIALNTGFSRDIADVIIERFEWMEKGLIDDYIASDEVEQGRPHPYMIEALMSRAGIDDPLTVAKIGDTAVDIEEGKNAGCGYVIAVTTGAYPRHELEKLQPSYIVNDLFQIPALLK